MLTTSLHEFDKDETMISKSLKSND